VTGVCDYGNEPSGSMKCGEFLDSLRASEFFREDCVPLSWLVGCLIIELVG
jgi:hypothetical protein